MANISQVVGADTGEHSPEEGRGIKKSLYSKPKIEGGVVLIVTSFFRWVVLFVKERDARGLERGSENGHFSMTPFMSAPFANLEQY